MRDGGGGEARTGQQLHEGNEGRGPGLGGAGGEDEGAEVVDLREHPGANQDAGDDGEGAGDAWGVSGGGRRGEDALEELPCELRIAGVLEKCFGELGG